MNSFIDHLINPGALLGLLLCIIALVNVRHATSQQDAVWDMPEDTDTEKTCRQIRLLETRVWVIGWEIIGAIGILIIAFQWK